jgi:hypothetical protein
MSENLTPKPDVVPVAPIKQEAPKATESKVEDQVDFWANAWANRGV